MMANIRRKEEAEQDEMDEWLDKVDYANKLVKDLAAGKISSEEFDRKSKSLESEK